MVQNISTTGDSYTSEDNPTTNYGTAQILKINDSPIFNMYINFDITSAPASGAISLVNFYWYQTNSVSSATGGKIQRTTSSWTETGVTYNNTPSTTATNEATINYSSGQSGWWTPVNITDIYKDAKTAGNTLGLYINLNYSLGTLEFSSREGSYAPYISITLIEYYVKTTGNDALSGTSWSNAWKTINKAATTVVDGVTVHIGFGDYTDEPAANKIAPQNVGTSGIYYLPETATTGGGTGTVSVEQNA